METKNITTTTNENGAFQVQVTIGGGPGIKVVSAVANSGGASASADVKIPDRSAPSTTPEPTYTYEIQMREVQIEQICQGEEGNYRFELYSVQGVVIPTPSKDMTGVTILLEISPAPSSGDATYTTNVVSGNSFDFDLSSESPVPLLSSPSTIKVSYDDVPTYGSDYSDNVIGCNPPPPE